MIMPLSILFLKPAIYIVEVCSSPQGYTGIPQQGWEKPTTKDVCIQANMSLVFPTFNTLLIKYLKFSKQLLCISD